MEIKSGNIYRCIKNVVSDGGAIWYIKDYLYLSEHDGCITDEEGNTNHWWNDDDNTDDFFTLYEYTSKRDNITDMSLRTEIATKILCAMVQNTCFMKPILKVSDNVGIEKLNECLSDPGRVIVCDKEDDVKVEMDMRSEIARNAVALADALIEELYKERG